MILSNKLKNYLKLFSSGLILLWLFLQSPFNPLYSDYTKGEMNFVKLNFLYWLTVAVFLFWLIFFINRSNLEKYSILIFSATYGLYLSFYIFFGFDVMDAGFSLSKQWSMYHGLWKENFDAIAGTNLIGGLWLLIPGEPLLIWARLGYVLLQVSILFVSYKILLLYFKQKQVFIVALPLSLFLAIWHLYFTINYDNLPFLFFALSTYFLLKGLKSEIFKKNHYIISGILIIFAVFCKITYIIAIMLPFFLIILDNGLSPENKSKKRIMYFTLGLLISFGAVAVLVLVLGGFDSYVLYFEEIIKELVSVKDPSRFYTTNHSLKKLYLLYKSEIMYVISEIIKYVFFIILIEHFRNRAGSQKFVKYTVILLGAFTLYNLTFAVDSTGKYSENTPGCILSLFLSIYVLWTCSSANMIVRKYIVLIAASSGMFVFSFTGSDLVFRSAFHIGSGFTLFAAATILIKESELKIFRINFLFIYYFVLIIFFLNIVNKKDNLYREPQFRFISEKFEAPSLAGIKSNPQRVEVVDSLLIYLSTVPDLKNKKIMFTHSNALMYYLTGSNYILLSPWDILNDYYSVEQNLDLIKPDLFVIPKISHRIRTWPVDSPKYFDNLESIAKKYYEIYDYFVKRNNYIEVYKNSFYTVYSLEKGGEVE